MNQTSASGMEMAKTRNPISTNLKDGERKNLARLDMACLSRLTPVALSRTEFRGRSKARILEAAPGVWSFVADAPACQASLVEGSNHIRGGGGASGHW